MILIGWKEAISVEEEREDEEEEDDEEEEEGTNNPVMRSRILEPFVTLVVELLEEVVVLFVSPPFCSSPSPCCSC